MSRNRFRSTLLFILLAAGAPGPAATLIVNPEDPEAYPTIQAAVDDAVDSDTVIVHPGTYIEHVIIDQKMITLTSTDPTSPAVVAATIIDGSGPKPIYRWGTNRINPHNPVPYETEIGSTVLYLNEAWGEPLELKGFTIQNGTSTRVVLDQWGNSHYNGGGFFGAEAHLENCIFKDNITKTLGGGAYLTRGSVERCLFKGNESIRGASALSAGSFRRALNLPMPYNNDQEYRVNVKNNRFENNEATIDRSAGYTVSLSRANFSENVIRGNISKSDYFGTIYSVSSDVRNNIIEADFGSESVAASAYFDAAQSSFENNTVIVTEFSSKVPPIVFRPDSGSRALLGRNQ